MKYAFLILFIFVTGCSENDPQNEIIGKWKGKNENDGIIIFNKNGNFEITSYSGEQMSMESKNVDTSWDIITEVEPYQLYITIKVDDKSERIPLGIYKIENNKLIIREPKTYHRGIAGISFGVSRYEMPEDFSGGILRVFTRINAND